ncbi:MAG: hypothetical protein LLG04_14665 [Parachlamydia sp.]|nr:hypothetical protein [Parachlamydia sp.]
MHVVVAMPFRPNLPLDPHWYTEDYVDYIAGLLPQDRYEISGYFVSLDTIPQFLDDMQRLQIQKGNISVLNFCDGGEWDGYPGLTVCRMWERHAINGIIPKSGADYTFILNSDDKVKMQDFLTKAKLKSLPQTLISQNQKLDKAAVMGQLTKANLDQAWPLFCKLNVGAGALSINDDSVCHTIDELLTHLTKLKAAYPNSDIILQPYLPGPEYTVLVLGDRVYTAIRRDFHNRYNIMYEDYMTGVRPVDEEITYLPAPEHVHKIALDAIQAIPGKQHYTRVDMRDDGKGNVYVIDINDRPGFGTPSTLKCMLDFNNIGEAQLLRDIVDSCVR